MFATDGIHLLRIKGIYKKKCRMKSQMLKIMLFDLVRGVDGKAGMYQVLSHALIAFKDASLRGK